VKKISASIVLVLSSFLLFAQIDIIENYDTVRYESESAYKESHSLRNGYWIHYNVKGNKSKEGRYSNDSLTGLWKSYYDSGNIKSEITYVANKANGFARFYYENGNVSEEGIWKDKKWVGSYRFFHENGNSAYIWNYNDNGKRTGKQYYFHENGNLMIEGEWENGKEKGAIKEYYENGSLKAEKYFDDGKLNVDSVRIFQKNEVPPKGLDVFDGNGYYKTYTKSKKLEYEGVWKGGKFLDGNKYIYNSSDKAIKIQVYRNGVKVGEKDL